MLLFAFLKLQDLTFGSSCIKIVSKNSKYSYRLIYSITELCMVSKGV